MSELPTKTVIEGYEIIETIGSGSTGQVYRATKGGDTVAIKVIHSEVAGNALTRGRFEREALAASRVDHPSCVKVHNVGLLDDGRFYLIMEFIEGVSLADLILKGKLGVERALRIADDILAGLETAHAADVIHRDIKPANIRIEKASDARGERARVLDFGLAKLIGSAGASAEPLTAAGMAVGTPTYMPPEWLTSGDLDPRSDLYSLSVVLYEMITGEPPFLGDEPLQTLTKHVKDPVPELELDEVQAAPDKIRALVNQGLEKDPAKRFRDAAAYREAIADLLAELRDKATLLMTAIPKLPAVGSETTEKSAATLAPPITGAALEAPVVITDRELPEVPAAQAATAAATVGGPAPAAAAAAVALPHVMPTTFKERVLDFARRHRTPLIASAAALVLLFAIVIATGGSESASTGGASAAKFAGGKAAPSKNIGDVMERWDDADLEPGGFAVVEPAPHGATECRTGAASGLDITVCEFASEKAAQAAEKGARKTIGTHTGTAVASGSMLLIAADRKGVDPTGKSLNKLINRFAGVPE